MTDKPVTEVIEVSLSDLAWIAQTVHQGYHNEGNGGKRWQNCSMDVCNFIWKLSYKDAPHSLDDR